MKITTQQLKKIIFESVKEALEQEISEADLQFFRSETPTDPPLNISSEELSRKFGAELANRLRIRPWVGDQTVNFARRMMVQLIDSEGEEDGPYKIHSLDPKTIANSFFDSIEGKAISPNLKKNLNDLKGGKLQANIESAKAAALKEFPEAAKPPGRIVQKKIDWSGVAPRTHYGREEISEVKLQFWPSGMAYPEPYSVTPKNWSKYTGSEMGRQYFVNRGGNVELGGFLRRYLKSVIGEEGEDGPFKVFHLDPLIAAETFVQKAAGKGASATLKAKDVADKIESAKKSILAAYPNASKDPGKITQVDTDYGRGQGAMPVYRRK